MAMAARKRAIAGIPMAAVNARAHTKCAKKRAKKLSDLTIEELHSALDTLPQEIYDQIYEAVFTASPGNRDLTKYTDMPVLSYLQDFKLLHISRETRALYAKSYYGNQSCFRIKSHSYNGVDFSHHTTRVHSWLKLLPEAHRALLHEVVMVRTMASSAWAERRQEVMGRDLWGRRYHVSQDMWAVQGKLFVRESGFCTKDATKWKPLSPSAQRWASDVFLEGIQYFFDASDKGSLDSVDMATW